MFEHYTPILYNNELLDISERKKITITTGYSKLPIERKLSRIRST